MDEKKTKVTFAVFAAVTLTIIFITVITVYADLYPPLKDWLKNSFTHHWIGKGVLSFLLFVSSVILFSTMPFRVTEEKLVKKIWLVFWTSLLGTIVIFSLYIYESFLVVK